MKRLNKERVTQTEALRLIDEKMNQEYADLKNPTSIKVVHFDVYFAIENGSVKGSVYYEDVGKMLKIDK